MNGVKILHAVRLAITAIAELLVEFMALDITVHQPCYFQCILISRFWNIEILPHFDFAFSQCATGIYQAFDGQTTEFSRVFL